MGDVVEQREAPDVVIAAKTALQAARGDLVRLVELVDSVTEHMPGAELDLEGIAVALELLREARREAEKSLRHAQECSDLALDQLAPSDASALASGVRRRLAVPGFRRPDR